MVRIVGIDLPENRKILFALPEIYGVGPTLSKKILATTKISADKRVKELTEEEVSKLQKELEKHPIEGDLRRLLTQNIRRLEEIGSYRGIRHKRALPARGQRTRSNSRTKRGKRQTVGAIRKDLKSQAAQKAQSNQGKA